MALNATEEALVRQLIAQQSPLLSLAGSEPQIISNLGATDVTIADLDAASSVNGTDLLLIRQGTQEKRATASQISSLLDAPSKADFQEGTYTSFATTGTGAAYALSTSPVITAYGTKQNFIIEFHADNLASATLNINGLGGRQLVCEDAGGFLVSVPPGLIKAGNRFAAFVTPTQVKISGLFSQVPAGTILHLARNTAPSGYLKANGALISRAVYSALFAAIGTTFGIGDGSTTFGLPDLRGEFLRGWDDGRGIDLARVFGSLQLDEFKSHAHNIPAYVSGGAVNVSVGSSTFVGNIASGASGGAETRPRNVALLACIKF